MMRERTSVDDEMGNVKALQRRPRTRETSA